MNAHMKQIICMAIAGLVVFSLVGEASAQLLRPPPTYRISGYVTDSSTGVGIVSAQVSIGGVVVSTQSNGYYSLSGLDSGTYNVFASRTGFKTSSTTTVTISDGSVTRNIALARGNGVSGYVRDYNNQPISGATVKIQVQQTSGIGTATTDVNGYYCVTPWLYGIYATRGIADKTGYWANYEPNTPNICWSQSTTQDFYLKGSTYQTIVLAAAYLTRGNVTDPNIVVNECMAYFVSGSTVKFGYYGQVIMGIGGEQQYTIQTTVGNTQSPLTSTQTGYVVTGKIEVSGITQGRPNQGYSEIAAYVRPSITDIGGTPITTEDPVNREDVAAITGHVGAGSTNYRVVADASDTTTSAASFNLQISVAGIPVILTVERSTTNSEARSVGVGIGNNYDTSTGMNLHFYSFVETPTAPTGHGLIIHIWFDSVNTNE